MAVLPIDRVVRVTLTREDNFTTRRGFGVPLFLSPVAVADQVDATNRTKVYGDMTEVAVDWATTDDAYLMANAAFSQNPRPTQIKIGYYDPAVAASTSGLVSELDAIFAFDNEWYWLCIDSTLRDVNTSNGVVNWIGSKNRFAIVDTNQEELQNPATSTGFAPANKGTTDRVAAFYHTDASLFPSAALAGRLSTFNFDNANSAYTAKFKKLQGIPTLNLGSAAIQAITGFTPEIGQAASTGHMTNAYVNVGGAQFVTEGSTLTPNIFIDEVVAGDWIILRTEERLLDILANSPRVPFTQRGMAQLASGVTEIMEAGRRAGIVDNDVDLTDADGPFLPGYEILVPNVLTDITASQRKSRIAPAIACRFRYPGAIHYTRIDYTMTV